MPTEKIKETIVPTLKFDTLSCASDEQVIGEFNYYCRHSKKPVVQKPLSAYSKKLTRSEDRLTVHLSEGKKKVAKFSFIPSEG